MRYGTNALIFCLIFTSSITFKPATSMSPLFGGTMNSASQQKETPANTKYDAQKLMSLNESMRLFLYFGAKIDTISKYSRSERNLALSQFLAVHDELLNLYISGDSTLNKPLLKIILKLLNNTMRKSVLVRKREQNFFLNPF